MSQTNYPTSLPVGIPGMLADGRVNDIETGLNDETAPVKFGVAMTKGTGDRHYKLPAASTDTIDGFSVHSHAVNTIGMSSWPAGSGIGAGDVFNLLTRGRIYVQAEEAVVQDDVVYARFAYGSDAAADLGKGAVRKTADNVPAWAKGTAYTVGKRVATSGGNLLECTTAGTSDASTEPTATTAAADSITDGTAKWKYLTTQAAGASCAVVKGAKFAASAAAAGIVPLDFSKIANLA